MRQLQPQRHKKNVSQSEGWWRRWTCEDFRSTQPQHPVGHRHRAQGVVLQICAVDAVKMPATCSCGPQDVGPVRLGMYASQRTPVPFMLAAVPN